MNEQPTQYDVTVTVNRDGGTPPDPGEYVRQAAQTASARVATVMSAHTAEKIISVVTVETSERSSAVAVFHLAVVSEALKRPVVSSSR